MLPTGTRLGTYEILAPGAEASTLALAGAPASTLTAEGSLVGTVGYFAPEQVRGGTLDARTDIFYAFQTVLSPDGNWMECGTQEGDFICRSNGEDRQPVKGLQRGEAVAGWYKDSRLLVVFDRNQLPAPVHLLDPITGLRSLWLSLSPPDPVGVSGLQGLLLAPRSNAYAYNVVRKQSSLYLIQGRR